MTYVFGVVFYSINISGVSWSSEVMLRVRVCLELSVRLLTADTGNTGVKAGIVILLPGVLTILKQDKSWC